MRDCYALIFINIGFIGSYCIIYRLNDHFSMRQVTPVDAQPPALPRDIGRIGVSLAVHPRRRKAIGQTASQPFQHLWIKMAVTWVWMKMLTYLSLNEGIPDIILGEVEIAGCFWGSLSAPLSVSMFDPCPFRGGTMLLGCSCASTCIGPYVSIIFKMSNDRGSFSFFFSTPEICFLSVWQWMSNPAGS